MKPISSVVAFLRYRAKIQKKIVFVPTMGALHSGHAALIRKARVLAGKKGVVVVSIFVNPTQFGPNEDFNRYPRPLTQDLQICREAGADVVFHPDSQEMYPGSPSAYVDESTLSLGLCGQSRPGHFRGVCTVVTKLFNLVRPDVAVFGEKDYQQLAIIRRMVRDLNFPIQIVGVPTIREADGLAISSRNQYLSNDERAQAPVLRAALLEAAEKCHRKFPFPEILEGIRSRIESAPLAKIDYVEWVNAESLERVTSYEGRTVIALAVFFGKTRLIDNILIA